MAIRSAPTKRFHGSTLVVTIRRAMAHGSAARRSWMACFVVGVDDDKNADATLLAAGERAGEEHDAFIGKSVHECRMGLHVGLLEGALAIGPCGPASRMTAK